MASYVALAEVEDVYTNDGTTDYRKNPTIGNKTGTWKACPYILGTECCERLASGYVTPLLGAFLADSYLGRYWTIAASSIVYVSGMAILALSASVHGLKPLYDDKRVCHSTSMQIGAFYVGLYLTALATGGFKPCVSSYGADQFDDSDESEKKNKSSFFNWFYLSSNIRELVSATVLVWIQTNVSWSWGFCIPKDKSLLYETTAEEESVIKGSWKLDHTNKLRN